MGTRSLTVFKEGKSEIVVMYRHMDGYPSGHGKDLAEFLKDINIVNGVTWGDDHKIANGMGCLAAQVVAHFKKEPGDIYLYKAKTRGVDEEFIYVITGKESKKPKIEVLANTYRNEPRRLFKGSGQQFLDQLEEIEKANQEYQEE
jgi:hypothetical protein